MTSPIDISKPINAALPIQQLTLEKKLAEMDKFGVSEWMKDVMDSLEAIGRYQFYQNLALRENYRIVSKEFDLSHYMDTADYYDLTSAITQEFEVPYHLKHYDIIGKAVNMLTSEYLKRPDVFRVRASDMDSTNERVRVKTELLRSYINQQIKKEIDGNLLKQGINPYKNDFKNEEEYQKFQEFIQQKYKELTPESIEKYMKYDFRTSGEHWGQAVLSNDKIRFNFREIEKVEFQDMLIADRCFEHLYLTPIGYNIEYWNPINVFFHQSPEIKNSENGDFIGRVFYTTKTQAIDRYGWQMAKEQIESLYPDDKEKSSGNVYGEFFNATMYPFPAYRDFANVTTSLGYDPFNNTPVGTVPTLNYDDLNTGFPNYQFAGGDIVQITEGYWRSQRRIGFLKYTDVLTGEEIETIVDDNFKPKEFGVKELKNVSYSNVKDNQEPNSVLWMWVSHIWEGKKINANYSQSVEDRNRNAIYFGIKPCDFQFKGDYSPFFPKLPVSGGVFNNRNAKSNSFVDLLKPYQIAYNAFMNLAYGIAQRNNGKMVLFDIGFLSNLKDLGGEQALEKAVTIGRELGILPIDSSPQNIQGRNFNQFSVLDLDETEKVQRLMTLAILWEDQGLKQVGINPQRQGQTQASESATGVIQAINNSYSITETYFENFFNFKKRKLTMLLDMAQFVSSKEDDIILSYLTSDLGEAFIKINGTDLLLKDLAVNVTNDQESLIELEQIKRMALENNTTGLPMSALISMVSLKTPSDIKKAVEEAEQKQQEQEQQKFAQEKELTDKNINAAKEEAERQRQFLANENQLDRENELRRAAISASGFDKDIQENNRIDAFEEAKLSIEQSQLNYEKYKNSIIFNNEVLDSIKEKSLQKKKQEIDERLLKLKEKESSSKLNIENLKNKGIELQNKNQIELANKKHKNDLELKEKEKELKELELKGQKELLLLKNKNSKKK